MKQLQPISMLRWYARWPVKTAIFGVTILAVCYPYPSVLLRQLSHARNPDSLINPHADSLQPLVEELKPQLADNPTPREALKRVERFVYRKVPYDWDWNTWGVSDYWPTVDEVMTAGREDCDGRAVVAASLLRAFDIDARLVGNFAHVWVETPHGETMSPAGKKAVVATDKGLKFNWSALVDIPRSAAYGIAVFPFARELIVLAVLWWLLMGSASTRRTAACFVLLTAGLLTVRWMCVDFYSLRPWAPVPGAAMILAGVILMLLPRKRSKEPPAFVPKKANE